MIIRHWVSTIVDTERHSHVEAFIINKSGYHPSASFPFKEWIQSIYGGFSGENDRSREVVTPFSGLGYNRMPQSKIYSR